MRLRLKKYPSDFTAHFNLGAALQQTGRIEKSVAHFRKALQVNPQSYLAHTNLGAALQKLGQRGSRSAITVRRCESSLITSTLVTTWGSATPRGQD